MLQGPFFASNVMVKCPEKECGARMLSPDKTPLLRCFSCQIVMQPNVFKEGRNSTPAASNDDTDTTKQSTVSTQLSQPENEGANAVGSDDNGEEEDETGKPEVKRRLSLKARTACETAYQKELQLCTQDSAAAVAVVKPETIQVNNSFSIFNCAVALHVM